MEVVLEGKVNDVSVGAEEERGGKDFTILRISLETEPGKNKIVEFPVRGGPISCLPIQNSLNQKRIRYKHKRETWGEYADYYAMNDYEITFLDGSFENNTYRIRFDKKF